MQSDFEGEGVMRGLEVRVAAVQLPPASGETEDNLKTIRRLVERTRGHRPDFILITEKRRA